MLVGASLLQLLVGRRLLFLRCNGTDFDRGVWLGDGDDLLQRVLRHVLQLGSRSVTLPDLLRSSLFGEEHKLGHIQLQTLDICLQALRATISSTMVNGNANGLGELLWDLGLLQFIQREALAQAKLHVVALCGRMHHWSQQASHRAREGLGCLGLAGVGSALLAAGLIQPCAHEHPVLAPCLAAIDLSEVHIGDNVVATVTHGFKLT
mmetsp:Transcript_60876/g.113848  ORF Transcript_60876/g.113848 Transcript_60876/m.113848 type:complete len:207 (+) Transcript_60876:100-720(+)